MVATSDELLRVAFERCGSTLVVRLVGELDLSTAPGVPDAVVGRVDSGIRRVTLDLTSVAYCDSSGVSAMLTLHRDLGERGITVIARRPPRNVRRVLELTGVTAVLEVTD
ncbi:MAG TPA: STAS domain-containing protein [Aquihabitans sp.]|jgi:anti-anti-sigma factor|nr:STAS domain-containing protein [Aquihabitans sp.]